MRLKSASAEFPNDNDQLHGGAIWGVATPCGPPVPVERATEVVTRLADVVERAARLVARIEGRSGDADRDGTGREASGRVDRVSEIRAISAPLDDGLFTALLDDAPEAFEVEAIGAAEDELGAPASGGTSDEERASSVEIAATRDDGERLEQAIRAAAAELGAAREMDALLSGAAFPTEAVDARLALMAVGYLNGGRASEKFRAAWRTWVGLVRGDCDDFAACAGSMLDDWCADLIARAKGDLRARQEAKRALRSRGVAAFGIAAAA